MTKYVQNKQDITLVLASQMVSYGIKQATANNVQVSISVINMSGKLKAFVQMDDAAPVSVQVAIDKATSAVLLQDDSGVFESFVNDGQPAMMTTPGVLPLRGGVPIRINNSIIGAVGVSGSTSEGDLALSRSIAIYANKLIEDNQ